MKVIIQPSQLQGTVKAVASKSVAHRLLIAAALADRPTDIVCGEVSGDIEATKGALRSLGSEISYDAGEGVFHVVPLSRGGDPEPCTLDVGESGSTLRFLLPVVCALGREAKIVMHGRLPKRPLKPLWDELERHGCRLERLEDGSIHTSGRLSGGEFSIAANVSSQYISGLLYAAALLDEPAEIRLKEKLVSKGYILLTLKALEQFGIGSVWENDMLRLERGGKDPAAGSFFRSPGTAVVEGDWSNGAFWEIAGMLTKGAVVCTGLDDDSLQGDRAVRQLKERIARGNCVVDVRNIPDLVPVLAVLAAVSPGATSFTNAGRLRIKESDRIRATMRMLRTLGVTTFETEDGLTVRGHSALRGGTVDSFNDHRIAMSAAIASIACKEAVVIEGAEAVRKSYPGFWKDFESLGGKIEIQEEQ